MEVLHVGLLTIGWIAAFLLGKELATGFAQWLRSRREG
jgi:hypothetical protein